MQEDKDIKRAVVATISLFTIKNSIFCNSNQLIKYNTYANFLIVVVIFLLYFRCVVNRKFRIKINLRSALINIMILCFILLTYLFNAGAYRYAYVIEDLTTFFSYSFFPLVFLPTCNNIEGIKKLMFKWGYAMSLAALMGFVLFYLNGSRDINGLTYSMSYGKNVCLPCLIMILKFRDERKWKDLLIAVSMIIFILLISSRFPLLYIMTYVLILFWNDLSKLARIICSMVTVSAAYFILADHYALIVKIISALPGFSSSSRTIAMLINGNVFNDSARSIIHDELIEKVNQSPIWGYGFGGGTYVLRGEATHGFIYDCFGSLGYVFGTALILISFLLIIITWWKNRDEQLGDIMLMFMCLFFPTITLQDSLFGAYRFWWLVAFVLYYKSKRGKDIYEY